MKGEKYPLDLSKLLMSCFLSQLNILIICHAEKQKKTKKKSKKRLSE